MAEDPEAPRLPSLVADELVDLIRRAAIEGRDAMPLSVRVPNNGEDDHPTVSAYGLPTAIPYAIVELLVEIRDELRGDTLPPTIDVADLETTLSPRLRLGLVKIGLDAGRINAVTEIALVVFVGYLRERGAAR